MGHIITDFTYSAVFLPMIFQLTPMVYIFSFILNYISCFRRFKSHTTVLGKYFPFLGEYSRPYRASVPDCEGSSANVMRHDILNNQYPKTLAGFLW